MTEQVLSTLDLKPDPLDITSILAPEILVKKEPLPELPEGLGELTKELDNLGSRLNLATPDPANQSTPATPFDTSDNDDDGIFGYAMETASPPPLNNGSSTFKSIADDPLDADGIFEDIPSEQPVMGPDPPPPVSSSIPIALPRVVGVVAPEIAETAEESQPPVTKRQSARVRAGRTRAGKSSIPKKVRNRQAAAKYRKRVLDRARQAEQQQKFVQQSEDDVRQAAAEINGVKLENEQLRKRVAELEEEVARLKRRRS